MANAPPQRPRSLKDQKDVTTCGPPLLPPDHAVVPQDPRTPCLNACFQDLRQSFFGSFLPRVGRPQCVQPQRAKSRLSVGGWRRGRALGNAERSDPCTQGHPSWCRTKPGMGRGRDGLQTRASICILAPDLPNIGAMHKHPNTERGPRPCPVRRVIKHRERKQSLPEA